MKTICEMLQDILYSKPGSRNMNPGFGNDIFMATGNHLSERYSLRSFPRSILRIRESFDYIGIKVLRVVRETDEYVVKEEEWTHELDPTTPPINMMSVYSKTDGSYMGQDDEWLVKMVDKYSITQIQTIPGGTSSCIGYCDKYRSDDNDNPSDIRSVWIGWSHRAACPFGLGDKIFDAKLLGNVGDENEWSDVPFPKVGTIDIETLDQAKQAALNFAEYVS